MTAARLSRGGRWLAGTLSATLAMTLAPAAAMAQSPEPAIRSVVTAAPSEAVQAAAPAAKNVLIFTETTQFRHTEAIDQGVPALRAALTTAGITSDYTNDSVGYFTESKLAEYDAIVLFNASGAPWDASEQAAFIAYQQAGGAVVGVHNATDMRSGWAWYDSMVGTLMPGHAATGNSPGLPGVVRVEDQVHPSTKHLDQRWTRADEWYNYSTNVRGSAHVLATLDETTYAPGGNAMGYDHPISWCDTYDGGKVWMTGMGHFGAHFTNEPKLLQHIVGGVQWASGQLPGDCGGTVNGSFEKVALDNNTSAPFGMEVLPDGRVLFTELVRGQIRVYNPVTQETTTAITIPVYSGGEDGLLGIVAARDFVMTGHIYVYYAPASTNDSDPANFFSRVSRFTMEGSTINPASEKVLITFPARRLPDEPGHTGGSLGMNAQGDLFIGIGDDVNPHSEPSGGYAPLSTRNGTFHDARETSANTNDLRGKLLRIHPEPNGTYSIPEGNLFAPGTPKTRPEIYAMGFRNPFRFSVDQETGWVGLADYSPDNGNDAAATRGPAGIAEYNLIKTPGNYGWPLCMGNNEPFRDVNYGTTSAGPVVVGDFFDCAAPKNNSPRNTGLVDLPAARPADMWYGYKRQSTGAITQGGGLAPMGGPFYQYDENLESDTKFPEFYDGKPFFYDWARNQMFSITLKNPATTSGSQVEKVNRFLPNEQFLAPIDSKFGPDGSLYVLDWGGGYGRDNPNSGLHKIDYISGSRSPSAVISVSKDSGIAPLVVAFDGSKSTDPENEELTYAWDFDGDGTTDSTEVKPSHTYTTNGVYNARLTVTDPVGKEGTATVPITVGNTKPVVKFNEPINGAFFEFGDELAWDVTATDAEDGTVAGADIIVQPALGHDYHAHPTTPLSGNTGTTPTSLGGHDVEENIFFAIDARYEDKGGAGGIPALTGSATTLVFPKKRQAEFYTKASAGIVKSESRDPEGAGSVITGADGAWVSYDPLSLFQVDKLSLRVSAPAAGTIELRKNSPTGQLLGTAAVPATGGPSKYTDVVVDVTDPNETFVLYVVFPGAGDRRINFIEAIGKGASPETRPTVTVTAPAAGVQLAQGPIQVKATATDAENTITKVEFFVGTQSLGSDTTAPYEVTWTPTADKLYDLKAVATNSKGLTSTSRIVQAQVGELFGAFESFTNVNGTFEALGGGKYIINGAGADTWQGTDQYSALYLPAHADEKWRATVKINRQGNSDGGAKAGLMIRNDITGAAVSQGYAIVGARPANGFEWLYDSVAPLGQLDAGPAAGTSGYPAWVRLERNGPDYTSYYSKNGVDFTKIGTSRTLPGAAAIQDIGMFVTSHKAGTPSEVEFQDFTFDDNPDFGGVVDPIDPPPSCVGLRSDEFDGTSVDTGRWTVVRNADGKPITVVGGKAVLPITTKDINEAETGPISYLGQPAPTGAWEAVTKLDLTHGTHWQYGGLLLHSNDDNYIKLAFVKHQNGNRFVEFQAETNGTRTTPAAPAVATSFGTTIYLKLISNGTNVTAAYSADGTTWTTLTGSLAVKANATIGLVAAGDTGTVANTASFDWFHMTPPGETPVRSVDDEFDGTALDGCRWNAVVRYDKSKVAVAGGELRITTQLGDIDNTNPVSPRNFILQKAPAGDWTIQTKLKATQVHRWQYAGLLAYGDDDNYVKLDIVAKNNPGSPLVLGAELASEVAAASSGGNRQLAIANSSESGWWYLKLTKTGNSYQGWVSDGGVNWTSLGAPVVNASGINKFGLIAVGPQQEIPVTIAFDYFHQIIEDTVKPVVSVSAAPVVPVSGWYTGAVTVSASATDNVDTAP
ncbi:DUF1349 domain-containing protein, partial [Nakamurella silvestris]